MERLVLCGRDCQAQNCQDFALFANDVINIVEDTTRDQAMIKTLRLYLTQTTCRPPSNEL